MKVQLNVTFPALHCDDVHLDVIDMTGDLQLELSDKMFKQRLHKNGRPKTAIKIAADANVKAKEDKRQCEALIAASTLLVERVYTLYSFAWAVTFGLKK